MHQTLSTGVAARFVTTARFVTVKFDAQSARYVTPARFVTTARFVTVKFDAQPARYVTPARFVTTW